MRPSHRDHHRLPATAGQAASSGHNFPWGYVTGHNPRQSVPTEPGTCHRNKVVCVSDPDKILCEAARTLDFAKPVALMLLGTLTTSSMPPMRTLWSTDFWTPCPRVVTSRYPTPPQKSTEKWSKRPCGAGKKAARPRSEPAAARRSSASSTGWNYWNPAWCRVPCGARTPATSGPVW